MQHRIVKVTSLPEPVTNLSLQTGMLPSKRSAAEFGAVQVLGGRPKGANSLLPRLKTIISWIEGNVSEIEQGFGPAHFFVPQLFWKYRQTASMLDPSS
jgi:hypothetical protein